MFASAGSYLADWYGRAYVRVGFTYDRGHAGAAPVTSTATVDRDHCHQQVFRSTPDNPARPLNN